MSFTKNNVFDLSVLLDWVWLVGTWKQQQKHWEVVKERYYLKQLRKGIMRYLKDQRICASAYECVYELLAL